LVKVTDAQKWSKKSYNNAASGLRRAFEFGYRDHPEQHDPAVALRSARIRRQDRPLIDPFTIRDAERLIAAIHQDWGKAQSHYDEFRFFTGLRPSEQIALRVSDLDAVHGVLSVTKARVAGIEKDVTKTGEDRRIVLSPRALGVLQRHLRLRDRLRRAGRIDHEYLFFDTNGEPFIDLRTVYARWRGTLRRLPIRYRKPYAARHSSVSWDLMIGRNPLWVAKQHGHSLMTMLRVYAAWTIDALEADIVAIKRAMNPPPRKPTKRRVLDTPFSACGHRRSADELGSGLVSGERPVRSKCMKNRRIQVAERVGFEPTVGLRLRLISSQVHSTTLPPLQRWAAILAEAHGSR